MKTSNFKEISFHDGLIENFDIIQGKIVMKINSVSIFPTKDQEIFVDNGTLEFIHVYSFHINGFDQTIDNKELITQGIEIYTVEETKISEERNKYVFKLLYGSSYAEIIIEAAGFIFHY